MTTIELTQQLWDAAATKAKVAGYADVQSYVADLIVHDVDYLDDVAPAHLTFRNREELDNLLDEAADGGDPIPVTPEFWAERRRVLQERIAARNGATS